MFRSLINHNGTNGRSLKSLQPQNKVIVNAICNNLNNLDYKSMQEIAYHSKEVARLDQFTTEYLNC